MVKQRGPSWLTRLRQRFASEPSDVAFVIRDPDPRQGTYRHTDPDLPVSGFAHRVGAPQGRHYDVILALDISTSTRALGAIGHQR